MISCRFYQANKKICVIHFNSFCEGKPLVDVPQVQAVLEHGVEEYNKDFPRVKITLYEVQFIALSLYLHHGHNQSCVAVFVFSFHNEKDLAEAGFPALEAYSSRKRGRTLVIQTMVLITESIPGYQKQHIL